LMEKLFQTFAYVLQEESSSQPSFLVTNPLLS